MSMITNSPSATWFRCLFKMIRKVERGAHEDGPEYVPDGKKGYTWFEMSVFTRWDAHGGCQVLCIDAPPDFPTELRSALARRREPFNIHDPFAMHADLWDRIVVYYDISVWRVRDPVRLLEKVCLPLGALKHTVTSPLTTVFTTLDRANLTRSLSTRPQLHTPCNPRIRGLGVGSCNRRGNASVPGRNLGDSCP